MKPVNGANTVSVVNTATNAVTATSKGGYISLTQNATGGAGGNGTGAAGGGVAAVVVGCVVWVGASVEAVTTTVVDAASCDEATSRLHPIGTSASTANPNARRVFIVTSTVDDRFTSRRRIIVVPPVVRGLPFPTQRTEGR